MLSESLDSCLRSLLPKPLANHHAFHSLAPPPTSLQNARYFARIGATDDADFAVGSAGSFDTAQRLADRARQASTAKKITKLRSPENKNAKNGIADVSAHPIPRILINRV